jgi:hypothetical protein
MSNLRKIVLREARAPVTNVTLADRSEVWIATVVTVPPAAGAKTAVPRD